MPAEIFLQPGPNAASIAEKRDRLAALRAALAEREADVAQLRSQLKAFEVRYLQRVGVLYAELDEIAARITEREVDLYHSDSARRRAKEARQRAQQTHEAAFGATRSPRSLTRRRASRRCFARSQSASTLTLPPTRRNESTSPCS